MYNFMHACFTYVDTCVYIYIYVCVHVYGYSCVCMHTGVRMCKHVSNVCVYIHIYIYINNDCLYMYEFMLWTAMYMLCICYVVTACNHESDVHVQMYRLIYTYVRNAF